MKISEFLNEATNSSAYNWQDDVAAAMKSSSDSIPIPFKPTPQIPQSKMDRPTRRAARCIGKGVEISLAALW